MFSWLRSHLSHRRAPETSRLIVGSTGSGKSAGELGDLIRLAGRGDHAVVVLDGHGPLAFAAAGHWAARGFEDRMVYEPLHDTDRVLCWHMLPTSVAPTLSQRLLAPIGTLTEGVKAVAAGDLTRKVAVRSEDEIGLLAREFNAMATSLDRQRDELRRAERLAAVGRISAQITHEIRNPLNAIGLNAELLQEELESASAPPCEAVQLVRAISREVDRLNGVAEEYLRFARHPRQLARQDVSEILGSLLDFLGPELQAARIEVERELAPAAPGVRGDEGQLRAVFLNLLRNSREAMPGGGVVRVRTSAVDGAVEVQVGDTGRGIPPDDLTRIFEPFYSTKERGTGLGLAFVQQVVREHGGTIVCESELDRGTTFTIKLPVEADETTSVGAV
jgi:signal transduction histidine kinase